MVRRSASAAVSADDEVTSTATSSGPAIGIAERKIEQADSALAEAKTATKVCFGTYTYPSPRDLGRTSNVRPESLINFFFLPKHAYLPSSPRVSTAIHSLRLISNIFCFCTQRAHKLRTGYFQTLLDGHRYLKRDFAKLMEEKKSLEGKVSELTGKLIFQILNRTIFPFGLTFASKLPFYSDRCSTEPFLAEAKTKAQTAETELAKLETEMAKMKKEHDAAMAKQKKDFETEIAKMAQEHETELEESAAQVNDARNFAQKANRTLKFAERDHRRAKESYILQAGHLKEMEAQEKRCLKFLRAMDNQLSGKFFLRIPSEVKFFLGSSLTILSFGFHRCFPRCR